MRYSKYRAQPKAVDKSPNPIWRGIGCIMFVITPIIAVAISNLVLATGYLQRYIYIPNEMRNRYTVPVVNFTIYNATATLILAAGITVLLYAAYFVVYAAMYKVVGPSPYGPTDVPAVRNKRNVRKSR